MTTKTFEIKYKSGHSYNETWNSTSFFCMNCGAKTIWQNQTGDYYQGEQHMCTTCSFSWSMPGSPSKAQDWQDLQRYEELGSVLLEDVAR